MTSYKCEKCLKIMDEKNFYTNRDKSKTELCKKCLTMHVDAFDPETFLWILKKMDYPYIEVEWKKIVNRQKELKPYEPVNGGVVFGKYLAKMRLKHWSWAGWEDTEQLNKELGDASAEEREEQKELEEKYKNGLISEAEYRTLMSIGVQNKEVQDNNFFSGEQPVPLVSNSANLNEEELFDLNLSKDEKIYLAMKWGTSYKISEWLELEKKYNEMMESFEINDSDTTGTLILICKTYLKMNQAIDLGDLDGYQKLSRTYDTLRKSSKFTAAQKEEKKDEFLSSVGELVYYCEKNGGKIPKFEMKYDLDIVDKVIRDLKEYNKNLIYEDVSLARQIEDYLKKREVADQIKRDKKKAEEDNIEYELSDQDIVDYQNMIREEKEKDKEVE